MERERETVEAGGTCCELQRRRMALNVQSPTGGQARERHRMRLIFWGIREISHCALMELTRNSDEKASALFEKYNMIYDKIS